MNKSMIIECCDACRHEHCFTIVKCPSCQGTGIYLAMNREDCEDILHEGFSMDCMATCTSCSGEGETLKWCSRFSA